MAASNTARPVTGLVLAGGRARRLGGIDKGLVPLRDRPMIEHVLARFRPQVGRVLISANCNHSQYAPLGDAVIPDGAGDFLGPLAGIASGLAAATTPYLALVPCDAPRVPTDLVARLYESLLQHDAALAAAHDGTRLQPLFALLARELLPDLQAYLAAGGRRVTSWFTRQRLTAVSFADQADAFWNINDPTAQRAFEHQLIGSYP